MKKVRQLLASIEKDYLCLIITTFVGLLFMFYKPAGKLIYELFIPMICAYFLGINSRVKKDKKTKHILFAAILFVVWYYITYAFQLLLDNDNTVPGAFMVSYLLALPFASMKNDKEFKGLKIVETLYLTYSLVMCSVSFLLNIGLLPDFLSIKFYFDGPRLVAWSHPNTASYWIINGILACFLLIFSAKKKNNKKVLLLLIIWQYLTICQTNSRTFVFLCWILVGGISFYYSLQKTSNKDNYEFRKIIISLVNAFIVMTVMVFVYIIVFNYQLNVIAKGVQHGQGSIANDVKSFNSRTLIWASSIKGLLDNPRFLLFGVADVEPYACKAMGIETHCHNSFLQVTYNTGIIGLLFTCYFVYLLIKAAVNNLLLNYKKTSIELKMTIIMCLILLVASFFEPFLFSPYRPYANFIFFLLLGYALNY